MMDARGLLGLCLLAGSLAAGSAAAESPGTYKEALACSGLLTAAGVYLQDEAKRTGDAESGGNAEYVLGLAKRWVGKAVSVAPDAMTVMDDVREQTHQFTEKFSGAKTEGDFQKLLGTDLDHGLDGAKVLPEN